MKSPIRTFILFSFLLIIFSAQTFVSRAGKKQAIKLGAYYFAGWAGKCPYDDGTPENAWAKGMPTHFTKKLATEFAGRTPVWGWRDDTQELMERQIKLASDNGISYFSFCWYWRNNKGPINAEAIESDSKHLPMNLFMKARNNKLMEYCLLIANHAGAEIVGTEAWKQAADYWIKNYFSHPRYLKSAGKPVVMIFLPRGADKEGLAYLQEAAHKAGFPGVMVAACGNGTLAEGFQAQTLYNTKPKEGLNLEDVHPFKLLADWNISVWEKRVDNGMPYIPVATQGWDRRPWEAKNGEGFGKGVDISVHFDRGTPAELEAYFRKLVEWMKANPGLVTKDKLALVYAWNEIGEGGWLVPCQDDPKGEFLKAIRSAVMVKKSAQ
ncbi:MAG: glycoside hydrolase family 99-like domain-containing protein [Prolixibacteraceae bacterium]|nr:glycoside hydrolase family 99-like domain-containing protein [Prolixibacteraceae bacterium]